MNDNVILAYLSTMSISFKQKIFALMKKDRIYNMPQLFLQHHALNFKQIAARGTEAAGGKKSEHEI